MTATASEPISRTRWRTMRRRFNRWVSRADFYPRLEFAAGSLVILLGLSSYAVLAGKGAPAGGLSPSSVTVILVANLIPLMALMVLIARRIAILLANRRAGKVGARLHVRMVALFAGIAAVPTVLVVVFASLLFQFGVQFWFSDRVKTVLDGSNQVAQAYVVENRQRVVDDIIAMASDINNYERDFGLGSPMYVRGLQYQVAARSLTEAAVFARDGATLRTYALAGVDRAALAARLARIDFAKARTGGATLVAKGGDRIEAVVGLGGSGARFVYVNRKVDPLVLARAARAAGALGEYNALIERSRVMQLRFNLILIAVSLLTLAIAVWFALWLANRLVAPIARLAQATERVGAGDLDATVPVRGSPDELGTLARAFNRMTGQLRTQQAALIDANHQLDMRRQFTEAVLTGVSAGVLSIDARGVVRHANRSAAALLETTEADLAGQTLAVAVPELAALLDEARDSGDAVDQVRIPRATETQTLSVRIAAEAGRAGEGGYVLTFDDISAQLADQRRAAWADVARRIAHEIKNPLTPIQLAAERLQRKYGRQISEDPGTFADLTSTIVRQVGDLRRMVDEFSAFARMPRPVFAAHPVETIIREALVLQEVATPSIRFAVTIDPMPPLVCDRQQVGRALTNLIKNAAESVQARIDRDSRDNVLAAAGTISVIARSTAELVSIVVADDGIGLPAEGRDRLTEPYMTTRARGTGLGLAIVKKIIEDHGGTLELGDGVHGGAHVVATFLRAMPVSNADVEAMAPLRMAG